MNADPEVRSLGFDAEAFVPRTQQVFRVDQVSKLLGICVKHVYDLIIEGLIAVPQDRIDGAPSRASILVPRAALVHFVERRRNAKGRLESKAALARVKNGKRNQLMQARGDK